MPGRRQAEVILGVHFVHIGDIARQQVLRPARTAGSVKLHCGIRLLVTGSKGPGASILSSPSQGADSRL